MQVIMKGLGIGLLGMAASGMADIPPPMTPPMGGQGFESLVTQSTAQGLRTFTGVTLSSFLKLDDSNTGFGGSSFQTVSKSFPVKDKPLGDGMDGQDAIDAQVEGDWSE